MRPFASVESGAGEDAFYGRRWRQGPREAILADIASYTTVVVVSMTPRSKVFEERRIP
jgi:hypothetical protein